jgi:hypothetical protein
MKIKFKMNYFFVNNVEVFNMIYFQDNNIIEQVDKYFGIISFQFLFDTNFKQMMSNVC